MNPIEPRSWKEYVGQKEIIRLARITVSASIIENRPLPNLLICGGYGLGKSTLARLILYYSGRPTALADAGILNAAPPTEGALAIDEIHNLKPEVSDSFNMAMDTGKLQLIGITTNPGMLTQPFRSRFRILYLEPYTLHEIATILQRICMRKSLPLDKSAIYALAKRSRLNPRHAINYLLTLLDIKTVTHKELTKEVIEYELSRLGTDAKGYTKQDRLYLSILPNRPVGLSYISSRLGIDQETILREIEPYLLSTGVIDRTPKGRVKLKEI